MKKDAGIFTFLTILFSSLVSAGPAEGLDQLLQGTRETAIRIIQFVSNLLLDINTVDEYLFARIILFIIILIVVYTVIKHNTIFGGDSKKVIQWIISSAIAILAIRFLPDNFIEAIMLQYGALAVGITVFLPLLIYFFFVHQSGMHTFGRKTAWLVFAAAFFSLWSFRYENLGSANTIYWAAVGLVVIAFLFDKSIHEYFGLTEIRKSRELSKDSRRVGAQRRLDELEKDFAKGYYQGKDRLYTKKKDHLKKVIRKNL